jgi:mono/diheme cytochrome c family protein
MTLPTRNVFALIIGLPGLAIIGALAAIGITWTASADETCCKEGDTTLPPELVAKVPKGGLHNPYKDIATVAEEGHKQFLQPGCNECHGGTGGGGICPALTQGVWFWGNTDDVLFTLGSAEMEKQGYTRLGYGSVHAPMPPMGSTMKTSDDLWKIIAWIRSINPPGSNLPDKVLPKG